jgi:AcrR family transcriptional regulator
METRRDDRHRNAGNPFCYCRAKFFTWYKLNVWFRNMSGPKMHRVALLSSLPAVRKHKGRPRCAESQAAILAATIKLLKERPLREVTAEAIAQRAGVSKATIYKWWPNKSMVALEAFLTHMQSAVETPNTGTAQRDFTEQLKSLLRFFKSPYGRIYAQFMAEGQSDPAFLDQFRRQFLQLRRDDVRVMWRRG